MKTTTITCLLAISFSANIFAFNAPEAATPFHAKPLVTGQHSMIVTNNKWATDAAQYILDHGGNAFDAAIAAAFVLGLTEPQSSGIGGGGYALTYTQKNHELTAYDGRETAPLTANSNWFRDANGNLMSLQSAKLSTHSIGTPGEVALLNKIHQQHGHLPWKSLLQPAITLAQNGFPMSARLYKMAKMDQTILSPNQEIRAVYFRNNNIAPVGSIIRNPAYAETLKVIADNPENFYRGKLADAIIAAINQAAHSKIFNIADFANYRVYTYPALCTEYRGTYKICSVPPSSSGGTATLELMQLYAARYHGKDIRDPAWMYYFLEASKLAFADRNQYLADPDFVKQPLPGLLDPQYIRTRSQLIADHALSTPVAAGKPAGADPRYSSDSAEKLPGTTSIAIVDKDGNAISLTVTIESQFGSHVFTHGFFLNNELTDFSLSATDANNKPIANSMEAGKRPRSSISPVIVLNHNNQVFAVSGSPGGSDIICYVAKNLITMLDMNMLPTAASATPNLCASNTDPAIELYIRRVAQVDALRARGEVIQRRDMVSGVTNILRRKSGGWYGAADPRREGTARGK